MPRAAGQVLVDVQIAVRQNVEPGALLIADHDGHRVLKLLAEADVEHAGIERPSPHAHVEPARARKRSGGRAGKNQIGGCGEHSFSPSGILLPRLLDSTQFRRLTLPEPLRLAQPNTLSESSGQ